MSTDLTVSLLKSSTFRKAYSLDKSSTPRQFLSREMNAHNTLQIDCTHIDFEHRKCYKVSFEPLRGSSTLKANRYLA